MNTVLKVENLQKYYKTKGTVTRAVDNISFEVERGEFIGIMGASGSGKTTILNCISTIDNATAGNILINETNVTKLREKDLARFRREELGFIFQNYNLLDTLNGRDNIALALAVNRINPEEISRLITETARDLDIGEILDKYPYEMSGGQQQRIACARAIITKPALILADEPTGALDSKSAGMLLESLKILNEKMRAAILMVTHDAFTASHCKRILFIRDGRIFNELVRGGKTRREFFDEIIEVISFLGGEKSHVYQ